jgi:hypothetical protein
MADPYRILAAELAANGIRCQFHSPGQLVVSAQVGPVWPNRGNSFWVTNAGGRWYLFTWVPLGYRVPPNADMPALFRQVKPPDLDRLLRSPHLARLRDLCLWGVSAAAVLKAAAEVPETTRLRRLHLGEAHRTLTDTGANILLRKSPLDASAITFSKRPRRATGSRFDRVLAKLGNRIVPDRRGL